MTEPKALKPLPRQSWWRRFGALLKRAHTQGFKGDSPPTPFASWEALAVAIGWTDDMLQARKDSLLRRANRSLDDLTALMMQSFAKIIGVMTVLTFTLAFGQDTIGKEHVFAGGLTFVLVTLSLAVAIWAVAPRARVFRKATDWGVRAMRVSPEVQASSSGSDRDPDGIKSELWELYQWIWHRTNTWMAIERMFLVVSFCAAVTLVVMAVVHVWTGVA